MPQQAPLSPSLPQNDTAAEQQARKEQLAESQAQYEWTDTVPAVDGVPVVKVLPKAEKPSVEWWLKLLGIVIEMAKNVVAVETSLVEQGLSSLDTALLDADRAVIAAIEKDIADLR